MISPNLSVEFPNPDFCRHFLLRPTSAELFTIPATNPKMSNNGAESLPTKEVNVLKGHEGAVLAARFNSNGEYCLSCGKDRTICLWNPHRGIHIKTYKSHGREVRDVHVNPDNSKLCSCGGDRQVFYWDVASGRVIRKFRGHDSEVNGNSIRSILKFLPFFV